jgi:uncharacterized protein (UPF0335 family)
MVILPKWIVEKFEELVREYGPLGDKQVVVNVTVTPADGRGFIIPKSFRAKVKEMFKGSCGGYVGKPVILDGGEKNMATSEKLRLVVGEVEQLETQKRELEDGLIKHSEDISAVLGARTGETLLMAAQRVKDKLREYADEIDRLEDELVKAKRVKVLARIPARVVSVVEDTHDLGCGCFKATRTVTHVRVAVDGFGSLMELHFTAEPGTFEVGSEVTVEVVAP